ncbi:oxidoreductase [Penicillium brevicompactum]|uniref:oxidoreductase n=1 Tax=Penicillium brevicompactum TaxID=5074 RepID=UPI0025406937|nr:oxidoreductase [Penicillium brevicompactum]KAJ5336904.1 oxidoreductase [Penicillium brevicompactum]
MSISRSLVVETRGRMVLRNLTLPEMPNDYILVKTKAGIYLRKCVPVALNPTDWKHVYFVDCTGCIVGCDYAGVVESVGSQVQKSWKRGDRVAGFTHGCNPMQREGGAFAEYVIAKGDIQFRIPDSMSFEAACTLGVGLITVGQNLYKSLQLPLPGQKEDTVPGQESEPLGAIFINGGATATGSLAIQFAKLSGLQVITTCSEANRSFVCGRGAEIILDYNDAQAGDQIRETTDDALEMVLVTISTPQSASLCAAAISSAGGSYNVLLDVRCPRSDVDTEVSMAYEMVGEPYRMGSKDFKGEPESLSYAASWIDAIEPFLDVQIRPHPYQLQSGGLEGIPAGLQLLRDGKVRARKLVYLVDEVN